MIQPKRSDRWPSRAGPPQLRLASKAAASSSSRRAITTRSAPICSRARPRAIEAAGAAYDLVSVAGALEIPAGIAIALDAAKAAGRPYDGAVALGCVVRGETFHFEIVAGELARALMDMSVERQLALGNGILTTETIEQAEERADPARGDKGGDAARAALGLAHLTRRLVESMKKSDKRSAARLAASQALYQMEIADKGLNDILAEFEAHWIGQEVEGDTYNAAELGVFPRYSVGRAARPIADRPRARRHARKGWPLKRVEALMRAILRAAFYELRSRPDVPARVAMTEYVDVAAAFFGPEESGMINAVLDALARQTRPAEFVADR